ncbi:unnamed protein product [Sphagnum jensenii]|uniref:Uncharacterized protein n=1 Tax=Sphagnum jensenii TaxID=128206 RepID=A0ABP1A274_9BRYO
MRQPLRSRLVQCRDNGVRLRDRNFPAGGDDVLNQQIDLVRIAEKEYDLGPAQCQDASSSSTIAGVVSDDGTNIPTLGDHQ